MLQVSFVGATEEAAREAAQKNGYGDKVAVVKTSFKANSKVGPALAGIADAALLDDCMWVWPYGKDTLGYKQLQPYCPAWQLHHVCIKCVSLLH